jgi:hypothetical protein
LILTFYLRSGICSSGRIVKSIEAYHGRVLLIILLYFFTVSGGGSPPDFIYWPRMACYIVLQDILYIFRCPSTQVNGGTTIDTPKRRKYNTKEQELFNDASREVNDAAT